MKMSNMRFPKVSSSGASSTGRDDGPFTQNHKETTLKDTVMTNNEGKCVFCY
jgi:hypothetical protein